MRETVVRIPISFGGTIHALHPDLGHHAFPKMCPFLPTSLLINRQQVLSPSDIPSQCFEPVDPKARTQVCASPFALINTGERLSFITYTIFTGPIFLSIYK